ncbi:MAG: caspase family protein [Gemmatimonadota bacterium]
MKKLTLSLLCVGALALGAVATPLAAQAQSGLEITIEEPTDWQEEGPGRRGIVVQPRSSIRVSGVARHPSGISELLLDGNRASIAPQPDGTVRFLGYVLVREKMTHAEITALTPSGERATARYSISPTAPPAPRAESPEEAWNAAGSDFRGKRWAVVIGISEYRDPGVQGLKYADRDAKAVYDFLRSDLAGMGGFAPENIQLLLNEDATYQNMRVALFDFLKNATEEDVVYIYYAGHGAPDPDRLENLYLLPYDANSRQLGGTGFPMEDMNRALRNVAAKHKILITDACHSGGITAEGTRSLAVNRINEVFLEQMSTSTGVQVMFTASASNQESLEDEQWGGGHGVFTHYLLEGLKGSADEDGDHIVSIGEAMDYTKSQVTRETRQRQVPQISSTAYDYRFPVALVLPGAEVPDIPIDEIRKANALSNIMTSAYESAWVPPDSILTVAGGTDTVAIHLANDRTDRLPPELVEFSSSNTSVVTVDDEGVITGQNGGLAQIRAQGLNRSVTVSVRVLPRPEQVSFSPAADEIQLVVGEPLKISTDLLLEGDKWMRGVPPKLSAPDPNVLRSDGGGQFTGERVGTTTIQADIGGVTKEWRVEVIAPQVAIKGPPMALPVGDSLRLTASRTRPDGSVLGDAANVIWRSSDTTKAVMRDDILHTRGIGKVTLNAFLGDSEDSVTVFILGDLLLGVRGRMGETILSVSMHSGEAVPLLPDTLKASEPALSPDGSRIAFVVDNRIHIADTDGQNVRRLTPDMEGVLGFRASRYEEHTPVWSNDGARVVYVSNAPGNYQILSIAPDGGDVRRLTESNSQERDVATSREAPRIAFERMVSADDTDIVVALSDGTQAVQFTSNVPAAMVKFSEHKPQFVIGTPFLIFARRSTGRDGEALALMDISNGKAGGELVPAIRDHVILYAVSPDGRWIAYHQRALWGRKNSSLTLIDIEGKPVKNLHIGDGVEITHVAWGASPLISSREDQ